MHKKLDHKGFTLIEIMIAIAIVTILAAIAIPNFISYRDKSYCSAAEVDARAVASAIAEYFSSPSRTGLPAISDLNIGSLSNGNTFLLDSTDPEILIIIKIETPNRCPSDYQQAALQANAESTGWDGSGSYFFTIKR